MELDLYIPSLQLAFEYQVKKMLSSPPPSPFKSKRANFSLIGYSSLPKLMVCSRALARIQTTRHPEGRTGNAEGNYTHSYSLLVGRT